MTRFAYLTALRNGQDFTVDLTAHLWLRDAVPLPRKGISPYGLLVDGLVV